MLTMLLMTEVGIPPYAQLNVGVNYLVADQVIYSRIKHVGLFYHFVYQLFSLASLSRFLWASYVSSTN